jgi:chitinase
MNGYIRAGYVGAGDLADLTETAARQLNVINIAFGHVKNSELDFGADCAGAVARIKSINPEIKIILSVGGWGAGGFSPMAFTEENRARFARTAVETVKRLGIDGIDIDWEYPCIDSAGIEASPDDKYNFTFMFEKLRAALDEAEGELGRKMYLTTAVGSGEYFIRSSEMDKVAALLDYVSIMTYDMRGTWSPNAGHHTNLMTYDEKDPASAQHSVEIYKAAGVPREKIVIGAAFYSRKWTGVHAEGDCPVGVKADGTGNYGPSYTELAEKYIDRNGYKRCWDDRAKAPYLFNGCDFISYDDAQSVAEKCAYIRREGLLGIMYWEHGCDRTGELLSVIARELA